MNYKSLLERYNSNKKGPVPKGFLETSSAAELLFGPAVRQFIKRLEGLLEKDKNE